MVKGVLRIMILTMAVGTVAHAMEEEQKPNAFASQMAVLRLVQQKRYEGHMRAEAEKEKAAVEQAWREAVMQGDLEQMKAHAAKVIEHNIALQAEVDGLIALLEKRDIPMLPEPAQGLVLNEIFHRMFLDQLKRADCQQRSRMLMDVFKKANVQPCLFIAQAIQRTFVGDDLLSHNEVARNIRRLLHIPSIARIIGPELDVLYIFYRYDLWRPGRVIATVEAVEAMPWLEELILHHDRNNDTRAIINLYHDYLETTTLFGQALNIIWDRLVVPCIQCNRSNILINILDGNIFKGECQAEIAQAAAPRQNQRLIFEDSDDEGMSRDFGLPMPAADPSAPLMPPNDHLQSVDAELRDIYQEAYNTQNLEVLEAMRDQFVSGVITAHEIDNEIALLKGIQASLAYEQEVLPAATATSQAGKGFGELAAFYPMQVDQALQAEYLRNVENLEWLAVNRVRLIEAGVVTESQIDDRINTLTASLQQDNDGSDTISDVGDEEDDEYPDEILDDPGEPGMLTTIWRMLGGW